MGKEWTENNCRGERFGLLVDENFHSSGLGHPAKDGHGPNRVGPEKVYKADQRAVTYLLQRQVEGTGLI